MPLVKNMKVSLFHGLIVLALLFNSCCLLANDVIPFFHNFGKFLIAGMLTLLVVFAFPRLTIFRSIMVCNLIILVWVVLSWALFGFNEEVRTLMINYFCWGIGVNIMLMQMYSPLHVMDIALVLSAITVVANFLSGHARDFYDSMVWTYAIFPSLSLILTHFVLLRSGTSWWTKLLYLPGLVMLLHFFTEANRGGFASLACLIYFLLIRYRCKHTGILKKRPVLNVCLVICAIVCVIFLEEISFALYRLQDQLGLDLYAVKKMYNVIRSQNVLNNRGELYAFAWSGFWDSPILGHGIGAFSVNYGGWVHNFMLQLLYEGGAVLFALVMVPFCGILRFFITRDDILPEEYALFVVLFCTSVPKLLFSQELWNAQSFWMLMSFGMITMERYKTT